MNIIKKIIKNKMKKVLDLFLNLGYNICVCERVRVNNKNNNMKNKKYVVVSVGGMNSENEKWLCEFSNLDNCFDYINEKVNEGEMYNNDEELDRNNIYWDSKEELDILTELTGKDFSALKTIAENAEKATAGAILNYNDYNVCGKVAVQVRQGIFVK